MATGVTNVVGHIQLHKAMGQISDFGNLTKLVS